MHTTSSAPSDAILTVPNVLTFVRLALVPTFLWLGLGPDQMGAAFGIAFLGLVTDLLDGRIARRYGQISKLGIALDPLADRLALTAGAVVVIVHELAPLWAILLVVARDGALLLVGAPLLKARGLPIPPVTATGKIASFGVSLAFGLFLASGITGVRSPIEVLRVAGIVMLLGALPMYYAAAAGYIRTGLGSLRRR